MPRHSIEFEYQLGDKVLLSEIQRPGVVDLLQLDNMGKMYRVAYWDDAEFFRRLAEKKGSPRIDFEEVLIYRRPFPALADPKPLLASGLLPARDL